MPSQYLQSAEYATYGVPSTTTSAQIIKASLYIDSYLYRPEGLIYIPDANGDPCYMAGLNPTFTLTASTAISTGLSVVVPITGAVQSIYIGNVVVLDRANALKTEVCVISSVDKTNNTVTLQNVLFNHDSGALLEAGMAIYEQLTMPKNRAIKNLSRNPIRRMIGSQGTISYGRRGDFNISMFGGFDAFAYMAIFGGPPLYQYIDASQIDFDPSTGQIFVPASIYLMYFTQIRLQYIAGFTYDSLPAAIKIACANLVNFASAEGDAIGNVKSYRAGDTQIISGGGPFDLSTLFDADTCRLLDPYKARRFG
jgi:hypothetical protein